MAPTYLKTSPFAGRKEKKDWQALKPEIETDIAIGFGIAMLARKHGMSRAGMRLILQRYNIVTRFGGASKA